MPPNPGRNAPCTCGSGKKSKKCCFDPVKLQAEQDRLQREHWARLDAQRALEAELRAKGDPEQLAKDFEERQRTRATMTMIGALGYFNSHY